MKYTPQERPLVRRAWLWSAAGAALILLALAVVASRGSGAVPVETARAARKDLVVPLLSDGVLETAPGGELRASEGGTVAQIAAREGERVRRGALLLRIDSPELEVKAQQARSEALQLAAERTRAGAELESERREAARLQRIAESDERLVKEGAITRAAREADENAYRQAAERVRSAQARFESLGGGVVGGRSRLALAEASARQLESQVAALTVRAPVDGVVYGLPQRVGETVGAGQVVANVAEPGHLRVRARVDQPDLPRVAAGQRLIVTFDGLPGRRWEGKVGLVAPGVREVRGREVGEVTGEIADPQATLPPNASVNVQIVIGEKRSALAIPRAALYRDGERHFVYVLEEGRARRREVSVGLIGINEVEIASGVKEGDRVILPGGGVPLSDGARVLTRSG